MGGGGGGGVLVGERRGKGSRGVTTALQRWQYLAALKCSQDLLAPRDLDQFTLKLI